MVGGGVEWKYNPTLSFRIEGLYYIFDETTSVLADWCCFNNTSHMGLKDVAVIRAGVSWQLGQGDLLPFGMGRRY